VAIFLRPIEENENGDKKNGVGEIAGILGGEGVGKEKVPWGKMKINATGVTGQRGGKADAESKERERKRVKQDP